MVNVHWSKRFRDRSLRTAFSPTGPSICISYFSHVPFLSLSHIVVLVGVLLVTLHIVPVDKRLYPLLQVSRLEGKTTGKRRSSHMRHMSTFWVIFIHVRKLGWVQPENFISFPIVSLLLLLNKKAKMPEEDSGLCFSPWRGTWAGCTPRTSRDYGSESSSSSWSARSQHQSDTDDPERPSLWCWPAPPPEIKHTQVKVYSPTLWWYWNRTFFYCKITAVPFLSFGSGLFWSWRACVWSRRCRKTCPRLLCLYFWGFWWGPVLSHKQVTAESGAVHCPL